MLRPRSLGESASLPPLVTPGVPRLMAASFQSPPPSSHALLSCLLLFPSLIEKLVIGFRAHLNPG